LRSAPPEFAASELIRFTHRQALKNDRAWQRELLEEAFALARLARQSYKRSEGISPAIPGAMVVAQILSELAMDRLSLQCSAIIALLEIDPERALELVREMGPLELPVSKCEEASAPNVDVFYQMLLAVTKRCFNDKQKANNEDIAFLETYLHQVNHPAQVAPASRIVRFYGTPEQLDRLLSAFLTALDNVRQDDRTFSTGSFMPAAAELQTLGIFCTQNSKRGEEVFTRLRRYLVEHLSGPRCTDNVLTAAGKPYPVPQAVQAFNQLIEFDGHKVEKITEDEIKPGALGGKAEKPRYWQTPGAVKMKQRFYQVIDGRQRVPVQTDAASPPSSVIQRPAPGTPEEMQAFQEFFAELAAWEPEENVAAADFYHQKCLLYADSFRRIPPSPLLKQVLRDHVNLLSISRTQFNSFPEWFAHLKAGLLNNYNYVFTEARGTLEAVKEALQNSDDPFIQLFLRLSKAPAEK
jgi:hypothetical protein